MMARPGPARLLLLLLLVAVGLHVVLGQTDDVPLPPGAESGDLASSSSSPGAETSAGDASDVDYIAIEPLELTVDVDGAPRVLACESGGSLRKCCMDFVVSLALPEDSMTPDLTAAYTRTLMDGLIARASALVAGRAAAAGGSRPPARRPLAEVPVNLNDEARTAVLYEGEEASTAARRFAVEAGLSSDPELDSILRTLVNRLRAAAGAQDGLPLTVDAAETIATMDVNAGDGTGRILVLRVLAGETASAAAAGFLERTGFDMAANLEALRGLAEAKLLETAAERAAAAGEVVPQEEVVPQLISPEAGFVLPVTFDVANGSPSLPLVYRYGTDPAETGRAFLIAAGMGEHERLEALVTDIAAAIDAQVAALVGGGGQAAGGEDVPSSEAPSTGSGSISLDDALKPALTAAPFAAVVPLSVGTHGYDLEVPEGAPFRAVARVFCAKQWGTLRRTLQAAMKSLSAPGTEPATVTPVMCAAITSELVAKWYGAAIARAAGLGVAPAAEGEP
jgi:hypothetical protein